MKVCKQCGVEKEIGSFYTHSKMADGHLNKCIDCVKDRVSKHRQANLERIKAYDKERSTNLDRVMARKQYAKSEQGKVAHKKAMENYKKRYPMAYAAHVILGNAVKNKTIVRADSCSKCSSIYKVEGHHDDYTKPLEVRWLCEPCHKEWHRHNEPIYK
jgi:hypothetical protein